MNLSDCAKRERQANLLTREITHTEEKLWSTLQEVSPARGTPLEPPGSHNVPNCAGNSEESLTRDKFPTSNTPFSTISVWEELALLPSTKNTTARRARVPLNCHKLRPLRRRTSLRPNCDLFG